ncbi:hypothetical protein P171DRAFT_448822 [Karstenula rhodostoma CBS 690.94]|uniref:Piwi domain-containing protein n=1 Tax=Karstenula rhodostoma CBS 690.94 TaxID=1392251 RepID=A0A9P4U722_9PLEO|nr:hypothetical protein P171DRAFT_448822 [Karstenula rhodostoma CBS 690.94]
MPSGTSTSLGSFDYQITNLPSFYVAEIETLESGTTQCLSRKLRTQVVESFVRSKHRFGWGNSPYSWVVNYRAKEGQLGGSSRHGPIDHLILLWTHDETKVEEEAIVRRLLGQDDHGPSPHRPLYQLYRRDSNGNRNPLSISCQVRAEATIVTPENDASLYYQCLSAYICSKAVNKLRGADVKPAHKEWFVKCPMTLGETPLEPIMKDLLYFAVRVEPSLRIQDKLLRLNFDLALGLNGGSQIIKFLCQYLGNNVLGPNCTDLLPAIKSLLIGLEVMARYTRVSPVKRAHAALSEKQTGPQRVPSDSREPSTPAPSTPPPRASAFLSPTPRTFGSPLLRKSSSRNQLAPPPPPPPPEYEPVTKMANHGPYRILDVKMPGEVPRFVFNKIESEDGDGGMKKYSVAEYFAKINDTPLRYPYLPYAKVRHDTWIPLELLETHKQQLLRKTGQMTTYVQSHAKQFCSTESAFGELLKVSKSLNIDCETLPEVLGTDPPIYSLPAKERPRRNGKKEQLTTEDPQLLVSEAYKIDIVYFPSPSEKSEAAKHFIEDMAKRVTTQRTGSFLQTGTVRNIIWVEEKLMLNDHPSMKHHRPEHILMCIVDELGRTKATVDHIRAECYRYAHLTHGSLAICVSKQDLDRSISAYASSKDLSAHFPQGIMQKINYMLTRTNHRLLEELQVLESIPEETRKLKEKKTQEIEAKLRGLNLDVAGQITSADPLMKVETSEEDLDLVTMAMIVGAHIAHPGASAAADCPSVAAIVGSNRATTHYFGSARVQATMESSDQSTDTASEPKPKIKHILQSRILDLKSMMIERLKARNQAGPIIVFRDSNVDFGHVAKWEASQIESAWDHQYPSSKGHDELKLVYIVVNRRSRAEGVEDEVKADRFATGKYQYTIHRNDLRLHSQILLGLVKRLNRNNQLGGDVSIALPIHFAQKLSRRFFSYFQFYTTDSASIYPDILQATYDPTHLANHKKMARFIQRHLSPSEEQFTPSAKKIPPSAPPSSQGTAVAELPLSDDGGLEGEEGFEKKENPTITFPDLPWSDRLNATMFYL